MLIRVSKLVLLFILPALVLPAFLIFAQESLEDSCSLDNIEEQEKILSRENYQQLLIILAGQNLFLLLNIIQRATVLQTFLGKNKKSRQN